MQNTSLIKEGMDVICSCGSSLGQVDRIIGDRIKLTKIDSVDGEPHNIPVDWVDHVDSQVTLGKNIQEVEEVWAEDALFV